MSILRQSLQQSGFANVTTTPTHVRYFPCPTGTFVNASTKHSSSCEDCPPGKFLPCDLTLVNVPSSISLSLFLKFQTLVFFVVVVVVVFFNMYSCLYSLIHSSILIVLSIRPFPSLFFDRPVQQPLRLLIGLRSVLLLLLSVKLPSVDSFQPRYWSLKSICLPSPSNKSFRCNDSSFSSNIFSFDALLFIFLNLFLISGALTFFRNKNKWNTLRK